MDKDLKNKLSGGFLAGAVGCATISATFALINNPPSEFWRYTFLGTFLLFVFLHFFFRDENFNKLQAINKIINWTLLPWLVILFVYAFAMKAYVAMFVSLGFLILIYFVHLLKDTLELEKENAG